MTQQVPVIDIIQYLGLLVRRDRRNRSTATDQVGYINCVLDRFDMTDSRKRSILVEIGYKPHAIKEDE